MKKPNLDWKLFIKVNGKKYNWKQNRKENYEK